VPTYIQSSINAGLSVETGTSRRLNVDIGPPDTESPGSETRFMGYLVKALRWLSSVVGQLQLLRLLQ
jgi:hypothetical protein